MLMPSAAVAVTLSVRGSPRRWPVYGVITLVFIYTTIANIIERPDGVKIASWFIVTITGPCALSLRNLRAVEVQGVDVGGHRVLRCVSAATPNAIAALLLDIRDETKQIPHAYFGPTEGNPVVYVMKFLAFGEGDTAPVTREVLRQSEPDPRRRPRIHVG
jgi:hypothetical protein